MTRGVAALLGWLVLAVPALAASPSIPLFADRDLGEALAQAVAGLGPDSKRVSVRPAAGVAACAAEPGGAPRFALLSHVPSRGDRDRCAQGAAAEVSVVEIGRQAVAVVVPASSPVWPIDTAALFHALGQNGGARRRPTSWDGIDPNYPKLPIGILLPPAESRVQRLFETLIMEQGCDKAATTRMPFDRADRASYCGALRDDIPVAQRQGGAQDVANWAAAAAPGQIAVVSLAELRQLDRRVVPLLLEGVLPTAANIESGRYPAADRIELMIVVPNQASREQRLAARDLAFSLLAEASIGPAGNLAPAGLIPLPPPDRLAARSQAVAFLEQP